MTAAQRPRTEHGPSATGHAIGRRAVLSAAALGVAGASLAAASGCAGPAGGPAAGTAAVGTTPRPGELVVAILLYPDMTALDAVGPYEVLSRLPGARVVFVGERTGPVLTDTRSLQLVAEQELEAVAAPDVLVVPGGRVQGLVEDRTRLDRVSTWIRTAHDRTRFTTSVCTGTFLLGAAGLLRGLPATTHWASRDLLARYTGAVYEARRWVRQDRVVTAAGVSAGIDMALYLAGELADRPTAEAIGLALEYDPQPPFGPGGFATAPADRVARAQQLLSTEFPTRPVR